MSNIEYITIGSQRDLIDKILKIKSNFVITDSVVYQLYASLFESVDNLLVVKSGEQSKSIGSLNQIVDFLTQRKVSKNNILIAVGGGVIGDLVGFVASIYMRGIEWINIPTTLLAQVDSSIGGKTAINYNGYKNLLGTFYRPKQIVIDPSFLVTLTEREWVSGVGEIVKTALLNEKLYNFLKSHLSGLVLRDAKTVVDIIRQCVDFKDKITALDIEDKQIRRILNLGHTIGHALESIDEYKLSHGEYILQGILVESSIFAEVCNQEYLTEVRDMLRKLINYDILIVPNKIAEFALRDKKNIDDKIHFIVPKDIGQVVEQKLTEQELVKRLREFAKSNQNFIYKKF